MADQKRTRFDILEIDRIIERLQQKEAENGLKLNNRDKTKRLNHRSGAKRLKRYNTSTY